MTTPAIGTMTSVPDAPAPKARSRTHLLARIGRTLSSPQLDKLDGDRYSSRHAVSCMSLSGQTNVNGSSSSQAIRVAEPERPIPPAVSALPSTLTAISTNVELKKAPKDIISRLPGELRLQVMSYLEPRELVRSSAVSELWNKTCFDGQLWSTLDTSNYYQEIPVEQLAKIITTSGSFIRYLNLRGCIQLQNKFHLVSKSCNNLVAASFEGCKLERPTVHRLVTANSRLVHLNLSGLTAVTNITCRHISESCVNLESLDISFCAGMDARGVRKVVEGCKNLNDLRAAECPGFNDSVTLSKIFAANKLERLQLAGCTSLTDEGVGILMEGIDPEIDFFTSRTTAPPRKLKHLDLKRCTGLTDTALYSMTGNLPDLEGLELGHVSNLTDAGFASLMPTLTKLTHLDLEECSTLTNEMLIAFTKTPSAHTIQHLQLSFCENMSDDGMISVIKKCTALRNLELDNTRIGDPFLKEAAIAINHRPAFSKEPRVDLRLVVFDCVNVNWGGIYAILEQNTNPKPSKKKLAPPFGPIVELKCYYGWQQTVDEHTRRVMKGDVEGARKIGTKWAEFMVVNEDANGVGRRRRRRARDAGLFDDGTGGRRRGRSGACAIM